MVDKGFDVIIREVQHLTHRPGVYRMIGADDDVLYVGKAKSLKKRVMSYTRAQGHTTRILRMIAQVKRMEFVVTQTEAEALLLEANLIKSLKPKYNVLLRDDKSFPYLMIRYGSGAPLLTKHRGKRDQGHAYFGPFASARAVNSTLQALQKMFLLRSCSDAEFFGRSRPCLLYQINRCSGPCTGEISDDDYGRLVQQTQDFLSGKSLAVRDSLSDEMFAASQELDFEKAAVLRDRLAAFSEITQSNQMQIATFDEADVVGLARQGGVALIQVFFYRVGQNWGNAVFRPRVSESDSDGEVLATFLAQFYLNKPIPKRILTSHPVDQVDLLSEALSLKADRKIEVSMPQRGEKKALVGQVLHNAEVALARHLAEDAAQIAQLERVQEIFGIDHSIRRIEVFDNSHIQGAFCVGAMIVAGREGFSKSHYRKFNIRQSDISSGDDYAMMREVFGRRFARLLRDAGGVPVRGERVRGESDLPDVPVWPDLVLVDGGQGQLNAVWEVLDELGVRDGDVCVVGVAKGAERDAGREVFYRRGFAPMRLKPNDAGLYYLQRLRDEAHRFAIGAHRQKRSKAMQVTRLEEIEGVGAKRKKALLAAFGTAKAVSRASLRDLERVEGISRELAQKIFDFFQG